MPADPPHPRRDARPPHPASLAEADLLAASSVERLRRSGPGGQHRNKVETGVRIDHGPTGCRGEAFERRSQDANRRAALWRLRMELALTVRTVRDDAPSPLWTARFPHGRVALSDEHDDLPALLAEVLDRLALAGWNLPEVAEALNTSPSQLLKLLQKEPRAVVRLNRERAERGLGPLR